MKTVRMAVAIKVNAGDLRRIILKRREVKFVTGHGVPR
jgi:hypothetical protein